MKPWVFSMLIQQCNMLSILNLHQNSTGSLLVAMPKIRLPAVPGIPILTKAFHPLPSVVRALLQGVSELCPVSSLGHTVILPGLLGWGDLVRDPRFLPLIVALHLGTSIALVIYFWRDWRQVIRTVVSSVKEGEVRTGTEEWV